MPSASASSRGNWNSTFVVDSAPRTAPRAYGNKRPFAKQNKEIITYKLSLPTGKLEKETWHGEMIGLDSGEERIPILGLAVNRLEIINRQQDWESIRGE